MKKKVNKFTNVSDTITKSVRKGVRQGYLDTMLIVSGISVGIFGALCAYGFHLENRKEDKTDAHDYDWDTK